MTDHTPDFCISADIATDVSAAVMEAAMASVQARPDCGVNLTEDQIVGLLIGMLRAAGRWVSFTMPPEMDPGVHLMLDKVLEQERRNRIADQTGGIQ